VSQPRRCYSTALPNSTKQRKQARGCLIYNMAVSEDSAQNILCNPGNITGLRVFLLPQRSIAG
jgi:hypothetical protein